MQEDEKEVVVSFNDDDVKKEQEQDSSVIKDLRKRYKDTSRELSALKKATAKTEEENAPLGARPRLEDTDYDEDRYAENLDQWLGERSKQEALITKRREEIDQHATNWHKKHQEYKTASKDFGDEFQDAEDTLSAALTIEQQDSMVHILGEKLAPLIVGLASQPKRLEKLAKITDSRLFDAEVGRLESKMISSKRAKTVPESRITGDTFTSEPGNTKLDRLRDEAEKTGDYTKVMRHKAELRKANE